MKKDTHRARGARPAPQSAHKQRGPHSGCWVGHTRTISPYTLPRRGGGHRVSAFSVVDTVYPALSISTPAMGARYGNPER